MFNFMAKVVFSFRGTEITIQCIKNDRMKDICNRLAAKMNMNMNSLLFLYGGNKINYEFTFIEQANSIDNNRNQMNILVYQKENDGLKCDKCGNLISSSFIDNIVKYINEQKDILTQMKNQINNIINSNNINDIIKKIKSIKIMLDNLVFQNEKCFTDAQYIISDNKNMIKKNYNFETIKMHGFNSNEEKMLKKIIVKSVEYYSNFKDICLNVAKKTKEWKEGSWFASVGEIDKYCTYGFADGFILGNINSYKIVVLYRNNK